MPRNRALKAELLGFVVQRFEVGRTYYEFEVNQILGNIYDDYVALRSYLIDGNFLQRNSGNGSYWRPLPTHA